MENVMGQEVVETSREMSGWLKLVGIVSIVGGAGSILLTFGIGIIFAWLPIWQGILLVRASNSSKDVAAGNLESTGKILAPLKTYFIIQGILILLGIFSWVIIMFVFGISGLSEILGGGGANLY